MGALNYQFKRLGVEPEKAIFPLLFSNRTSFESMVAHAKRPVETRFLRNLKPGSLIFILIVVLLNNT